MNDQKTNDALTESRLNAGLGYWSGFCCPKCGSYMFGSSRNSDGTWSRRCYGNEQWKCDYSAHESEDSKHFKTFMPNYEMKWQPIETCPPFEFDKANWSKDGPRYLLWVGHCTIGSYGYTEKGKGRWRNHFGNIHPTHWMPLPEAPNGAVETRR